MLSYWSLHKQNSCWVIFHIKLNVPFLKHIVSRCKVYTIAKMGIEKALNTVISFFKIDTIPLKISLLMKILSPPQEYFATSLVTLSAAFFQPALASLFYLQPTLSTLFGDGQVWNWLTHDQDLLPSEDRVFTGAARNWNEWLILESEPHKIKTWAHALAEI